MRAIASYLGGELRALAIDPGRGASLGPVQTDEPVEVWFSATGVVDEPDG